MFTSNAVTRKCYSTRHSTMGAVDIERHVQNENWLTEFVHICRPATSAIFDKHVGEGSIYHLKSALIRSLKFHYAVLSDKLTEIENGVHLTTAQKSAIILKVNEGIANCTPGFHARVDSLIKSYYLPKTIEEILSSIRYEIVETTAIQTTDDVHANNQFFIIASSMGLGVEPKLSRDPYAHRINKTDVIEKLQQSFKEKYRPFVILLKIKETIASSFDNYTGENSKGYTAETYLPGLEYLKILFKESELNYGYLVLDENTNQVTDFNWNMILTKMWNVLIQDKYFNFSTWLDWFEKKNLTPVTYVLNRFFNKTNYEVALDTVQALFLNPITLDNDAFEKLASLFLSTTDCFAYLACNRELSNSTKIAIIFSYMQRIELSKLKAEEKNIQLTSILQMNTHDDKNILTLVLLEHKDKPAQHYINEILRKMDYLAEQNYSIKSILQPNNRHYTHRH